MPNIYEKMSAITAELQTVAKNLDVSTGKGKGYKAVSERDVIEAVKPLEIKHRIYSYPSSRDIVETSILETDSDYGKKTTFFSRIKTIYRFVDIDKPEDFIETTVFSEGIDTQDKGSGKAMTYADKYALLKAYKISTGDDPDKEESAEVHYSRPSNEIFKCAECGTVIKASTSKSGQEWTPAQIAGFSKKKYGRCLCPDCQRKEQG